MDCVENSPVTVQVFSLSKTLCMMGPICDSKSLSLAQLCERLELEALVQVWNSQDLKGQGEGREARIAG